MVGASNIPHEAQKLALTATSSRGGATSSDLMHNSQIRFVPS
jgi:hypothetical protein